MVNFKHAHKWPEKGQEPVYPRSSPLTSLRSPLQASSSAGLRLSETCRRSSSQNTDAQTLQWKHGFLYGSPWTSRKASHGLPPATGAGAGNRLLSLRALTSRVQEPQQLCGRGRRGPAGTCPPHSLVHPGLTSPMPLGDNGGQTGGAHDVPPASCGMKTKAHRVSQSRELSQGGAPAALPPPPPPWPSVSSPQLQSFLKC